MPFAVKENYKKIIHLTLLKNKKTGFLSKYKGIKCICC